jgi:hypothetical protein
MIEGEDEGFESFLLSLLGRVLVEEEIRND